MKRFLINAFAMAAMVSVITLSSCGDDDGPDCGLGDLESAFNAWDVAYDAYLADQTVANCEAVHAAIAHFDEVGEGYDEACGDEWDEDDLTNVLAWAFAIGFSEIPEDCADLEEIIE